MFGDTGSGPGDEPGSMAAIPGDVDTDRQPPMTVPLRHFLVGIGFLLAGSVAGIGLVAGVVPGLGGVAHVHLLLAGWVCVTIMGAMTQFVPVWSGVSLYSRRLASVQLVLVAVGLVGFVAGLLTGALAALPAFGALMLAGFWAFVYNVGRTLATADGYDVTERQFLLSLGFFLVLTALGFALAVDFTRPVFASVGADRSGVLLAHATFAVFGAVLTTIYGALYQLGTMFTQTELHGVDEHLRRVQEVGHPVGVVFLATGRFAGSDAVASVGGVLVCLAALAFAAILARKLHEMRVEWKPMHARYAVVVPALVTWALLTLPAWVREPTTGAHLFGGSGTVHLLVLGVVGFVVLGTLYHVVPFIVWVHHYSDLLGFEDVPMIDDLYRDDLAAWDGGLLVSGTVLLVVTDLVGAPDVVGGIGGAFVCLGVGVFTVNVLGVLRNHSPHSVGRILFGERYPDRTESLATGPADSDGGLE